MLAVKFQERNFDWYLDFPLAQYACPSNFVRLISVSCVRVPRFLTIFFSFHASQTTMH